MQGPAVADVRGLDRRISETEEGYREKLRGKEIKKSRAYDNVHYVPALAA